MAESNQYEHEIPVTGEDAGVETTDRGLFDFLGKKEETKPQEEVIAAEFEEKVQVSEPEHKGEEKKHSLLEKLHRSDSSSSSSSDEEGDDEEKKKKKKDKKGLKEKLKEKISGEKPDEKKHWELETNTAAVEVKKHEEDNLPGQTEMASAPVPEEKKGFLEKIKDKLPGQNKKAEEVVVSSTPPPLPPAAEHVSTETHETEPKEKKGFLEKIKEKLPGYHSKTEEEKEKEKEKGSD